MYYEAQVKKMKVLALIIISVGLLVILGWYTQNSTLLRVIELGPTMKFNTAFSFVLSGIVILLISSSSINKKAYLPFSIAVFLISGFTLTEYFFSNLNVIDYIAIQDKLSTKSPGRMSLATCLNFLLFSLSTWLISSSKKKSRKVGEYFIVIILILSTLSIISFLLQVPMSNRLAIIDTMAIHTSVLFILLGIATSLKNPETGFIAFRNSRSAGDKMIRMVLPFILIIPVGLSIIFSMLNNAGVIDVDLGLVLFSVVLILIGSMLITLYGNNLNRLENQKKALEKSFEAVNKELLDYKYAIDQVLSVSIISTEQKLIYVNDTFCETSEYSRNEIIGKGYELIRTDHHPPEFYDDLWGTISNGNIWQGEILNMSKSGKKHWFHLTIVPFKNSEGIIFQYLTLAKNISLEKKAEQLNSQYLNELKSKNTELEEFSYITSHDLQEPLRTLTNYSGLFVKKYHDILDKQGIELLEFISSATERMQTLIRDVLDYSRIGKEKSKVEIDVFKVVEHVAQDLSTLINNSKTEIRVNNEFPKIYGYETEIRLVFQNLITNAIKFKKIDKNPYIEIGYNEEQGNHKFFVADNGIGIDPNYKDKVFQIFQRLHKQSAYSGTGIGLAHCKKIIERHRGQIWFEPNNNEGTIFYFTIMKNNNE
ncbi:ATP-binding protein [uncultured Roseivirga sp.]|uniref:sensor histidine kinase n=1 Tax=uncultured Roseivirga sp. TaxID=543088 RepID=UPI0030D8BA66|tara:strand:+ start:134211 stop:136163 length:1953 start_codon:yes stop_codon:yes gene_type:complete